MEGIAVLCPVYTLKTVLKVINDHRRFCPMQRYEEVEHLVSTQLSCLNFLGQGSLTFCITYIVYSEHLKHELQSKEGSL